MIFHHHTLCGSNHLKICQYKNHNNSVEILYFFKKLEICLSYDHIFWIFSRTIEKNVPKRKGLNYLQQSKIAANSGHPHCSAPNWNFCTKSKRIDNYKSSSFHFCCFWSNILKISSQKNAFKNVIQMTKCNLIPYKKWTKKLYKIRIAVEPLFCKCGIQQWQKQLLGTSAYIFVWRDGGKCQKYGCK